MNNKAIDRITGVVFFIIGALVAYGAWVMPRFENVQAKAFEVPGLTPGLLGCALSFCGLILALRPNSYQADNDNFWREVAGSPVHRKRALAALGLTLGYGVFLFGSVPYVVATFIFVFAFIVIFEIILRPSDVLEKRPSTYRVLAVAALIAVLVSVVTYYVFQTLFLVRLP